MEAGKRLYIKQFDLPTRGDWKDSTLLKCVDAVYLIISPLSSGCPTSSRAAVLQNTFDISTFGTLSDTCTRPVVPQLSGSMTAREHSQTNHFRQRRETSRSVFLVESREVSEVVSEVNQRGQVSSIKTYDFSSLYTNLPHNELKERLVKESFEGLGKKCQR